MLHRLAKLVKIRNITKLKKFNKPTKPVNAIALHINKSKKIRPTLLSTRPDTL